MKTAEGISRMVKKYETVANLEISSTVAMVRQHCPVCYDSHREADSPYWISLATAPICHECAQKYALDLLEIVESANAYYWIKDPDGRVADSHHRMEILAPVLSDKEKVKLWGKDWEQRIRPQPSCQT